MIEIDTYKGHPYIFIWTCGHMMLYNILTNSLHLIEIIIIFIIGVIIDNLVDKTRFAYTWTT